MYSIINKLKVSKIEKILKINKINDNGTIVIDDRKIKIYKVVPVNLINYSQETKKRIYDSYMTVIRGMPSVFQIIICKKTQDFDEDIKYYKQRIKTIEDISLKYAIEKYINYLKELKLRIEFSKTIHYLIVDANSDIEEVFKNLEELGIKAHKVKTKLEVEKVLKQILLKESSGKSG